MRLILFHQEHRAHDVVHYFLTAAHLLNPEALGERRTVALRVRLLVDDSTSIETTGSAAVFPAGVDQGLDVAIVKATSAHTTLVPLPITMESPAPGNSFVVKCRQGGEFIELRERVRFRSSRLVVGDQTAPDVNGLMGAPLSRARHSRLATITGALPERLNLHEAWARRATENT